MKDTVYYLISRENVDADWREFAHGSWQYCQRVRAKLWGNVDRHDFDTIDLRDNSKIVTRADAVRKYDIGFDLDFDNLLFDM